MVGSPGPSFSYVTWLYGIVLSLLLKMTGHLQTHHQYLFANIHQNLWAKQMIYFPPKKGTASKKPNSPPAHELVYLSTGRHGNLVVLCTWVATKRMWESQIMLATACQIHSSGERSYGPWPSVFVWSRQIHSCSLFRLSKQDLATLICGLKQCQVNQ